MGFASWHPEILAAVTRNLVSAIDGRGVDRARLLDAAGLSEQAIADPDDWLPLERHVRLGRAILAALPGENLGLQTGAGIYGDPRGALGYVLRRSQTLSQALKNFAAYQRVVNHSLRVELGDADGAASFDVHLEPDLAALGHPAEALFAAFVSISRHLTCSAWQPLAVHFTHQPHGSPSEHESFFGCPPVFGSDRSRLTLPASALGLPIRGVPHDLESSFLRSLQARWRGAPFDVTAIAAALPSAVRLAYARGLLACTRSFVFELAFLLGFEEVREFERAFTEHFGVAPRALRRSS